MTDVFDPNEDKKTTLTIAEKLKSKYEQELVPISGQYVNDDERARRTRLVNRMPDVDLLRQIVRDIARILVEDDIHPSQVTW